MRHQVMQVAVLLLSTGWIASCSDGRAPIRFDLGGEIPASTDTSIRLGTTCDSNPELDEISYAGDEILITVVGDNGSQDECQDSLTVDLDGPLGDRVIVDTVSGVRFEAG